MEALVICSGPPYGTEGSYNGLRLGRCAGRLTAPGWRVFLLGTF
jgi:hypothetical protein